MSKKTKKYDSPLQATVSGILDLFKKRERVGSLDTSDNLTGKKVLITGSSSGLGLAVAKQLAKLDAEVIMAVRSGIPEKGEEVMKASGSNKIKMLSVDLSDFNSIKNLISEVKSKIGKIDVLICNAAIVVNEARKTAIGLDEMLTVNYLSKFVLVNGLLNEDCFNTESNSIPKIIFISSESHRNPKAFEWDTFGKFQEHKMAKTVERYGYYKLLLTTFAQELERRLNKEKVNYSVFALCPGPINSNIAREAPKLVQPAMKLVFKLFFSSPEKAAEPVVYLTTSKDVEGKNKDYLFLMSKRDVDDNASNPENGKRLWEMTENLLKEHV
ncbi:SDR family NAD(P)-dependent oxidoreductase [Formosa maritima]|uniref:SDR family NAD(P)-dependent oxidoreductase n=1 Tax=Formosa maritima TaxID=2592046 RepID=A0A5D0G4D1_9FLAO|nr:SDR family NAD(P)-dependent oxidoreductase [Formosa maritima]TYA53826.1 SDR family NAD(P)-dependent oxidoreductase [Formosa maritima]